jgi:uncharacterized protein
MSRAYSRRLIDDDLDELLPQLAAIAIEGAKGVGKSETAKRRANTILNCEESEVIESLVAYPARLDQDAPPVLLDEWQRYPPSWDLVRRSVDRDSTGGRFLLTGSATPVTGPMHSGAGRIVRLRMRPMSLAERDLPDVPTVSLARLIAGDAPAIGGEASMTLDDYVHEILASGLPGVRTLGERARNLQLDGYVERIVDTEFAELGHRIRRPASLRGWMAAYAAATATTAAYGTILHAATPGQADKPAKTTTMVYRDVLERLWVLDPLPGWTPSMNTLSKLGQAPKHHLADPALAARLLGATRDSLLRGNVGGPVVREGLLLGGLFESLVTLSVRAYAQQLSARVHHLRLANGDHEVDLIVEAPDHRVVALEVKLAGAVTDDDVKHLKWLRSKAPDLVADAAIITTGQYAYRRPDGIAVIPASLLGP